MYTAGFVFYFGTTPFTNLNLNFSSGFQSNYSQLFYNTSPYFNVLYISSDNFQTYSQRRPGAINTNELNSFVILLVLIHSTASEDDASSDKTIIFSENLLSLCRFFACCLCFLYSLFFPSFSLFYFECYFLFSLFCLESFSYYFLSCLSSSFSFRCYFFFPYYSFFYLYYCFFLQSFSLSYLYSLRLYYFSLSSFIFISALYFYFSAIKFLSRQLITYQLIKNLQFFSIFYLMNLIKSSFFQNVNTQQFYLKFFNFFIFLSLSILFIICVSSYTLQLITFILFFYSIFSDQQLQSNYLSVGYFLFSFLSQFFFTLSSGFFSSGFLSSGFSYTFLLSFFCQAFQFLLDVYSQVFFSAVIYYYESLSFSHSSSQSLYQFQFIVQLKYLQNQPDYIFKTTIDFIDINFVQ